MKNKILKNKIKYYRTWKGITQEELGKRTGMRRETIISMEKGKHTPSLISAFKVSRELDCNIEELFILDEE